jgi:hypothetical protein
MTISKYDLNGDWSRGERGHGHDRMPVHHGS